MTTPLSRAIDDLGNSKVWATDALRSLLIVAKRVDSVPLSDWVLAELEGYADDAPLPQYRQLGDLPIELTWNGPLNSRVTSHVSAHELPEKLRPGSADLRQPLAELEELGKAKTDPKSTLPGYWVEAYRRAHRDGEAPGWEMMVMNVAAITYPRTVLKALVDQVRTSALTLALDLEGVNPEVGSATGPTTASEPQLQQPLSTFVAHIYGDNATLTVGNDATVASGQGSTAIRLEAGDVDGLLAAAGGLLDTSAVNELREALAQDGTTPGEHTRGFLAAVKSGAVSLALGMTGNGAYDGLTALLGQVFPGFNG